MKNQVFEHKGVEIVDTYAEMFPMWASRLIITADSMNWASTAARSATGYATSIIGSPAESGIESKIKPEKTPDGRPGIIIQIYHKSRRQLKNQMVSRIGQCVLTCPTTSVFDGLSSAPRKIRAGASLRYFGDGFEKKSELSGRTVWNIPVMESSFIIEESFGIKRAVAGGNILIMATNQKAALEASEKAIREIKSVPGVIAPFPGGICRSGTKIGSRHYKLKASTNTAFCPTLRGDFEESFVPNEVKSIYELVINGLNLKVVKEAMAKGIKATVLSPDIVRITSANYGGKLGPYKAHLRELIAT
jgi:formylmethanofuran--tetrahydromethanopterin N-formyltransferase